MKLPITFEVLRYDKNLACRYVFSGTAVPLVIESATYIHYDILHHSPWSVALFCALFIASAAESCRFAVIGRRIISLVDRLQDLEHLGVDLDREIFQKLRPRTAQR